ncbi:hypothetical protein BDW62DRAFT_155336 [Aspergillus aurantiobrunneus]
MKKILILFPSYFFSLSLFLLSSPLGCMALGIGSNSWIAEGRLPGEVDMFKLLRYLPT